jgi:hypothetical protein
MGFGENTHFIQIRPEEREGTMRIRADMKENCSDSRFTPVASFEIPPMEECQQQKTVSVWEKPIWKRAPRRNESDDANTMEEDKEPLTMDEIIHNL